LENIVIKSINRGIVEEKAEWITEEEPLTIEVNGRELATLLCSPSDLKSLVAGFLFTSGFIEEASQITSLVIDKERWKAYVEASVTFPPEMLFKRIYTSGCGKGIIFHSPLDMMQRTHLSDGFTVEAEKISAIMKEFLTSSMEYRQTGGVHSCAIADKTGMIMKDDIGRHNALDKVIGEQMLKKADFSDKLVLTSGRISSEIISKVLRCKAPVMVSAGAPTNQAVKIAREANLTLVGFARGRRMNIYSGAGRIIAGGEQKT
jgi:FdhD protein